jgi:osmotically-inducible protein OsmY
MKNITRKFATLVGILFVAITLGCASTAKQEGTGEYVDDTVITTKVKAAILNEPTLKSAEINVETFKGVVQLSGFVTSQAAENKAIEVARTVGGVKSVKNDMRLK